MVAYQINHFRSSINMSSNVIRDDNISHFKVFSSLPKVHVTVKHGTPNQMQDAMNVWIEHVSTTRFEVCLQEWRKFDGPHNNLSVVGKNSVLFYLS